MKRIITFEYFLNKILFLGLCAMTK